MPPNTTVDCLDVSSDTITLSARYDQIEVSAGPNKSYWAITNWWHQFSTQAEDLNGLSMTFHNPDNSAVMAGDNNPMGFPSMFVGSYGGHTTAGSNLPKQVSALTSVPTIYETNNSTLGSNANHNATYDVWFTQSADPLPQSAVSPGMGGAYLMVWMFQPTNRQPRGRNAHPNVTIPNVQGTWDVWIDTTNPPCISYVSHTPIDGLQYDLNDFIKDSVGNSYGVTSSMYLSVVFGGFEIWGNSDGLSVKRYCVNVK
ncbi:MAG: hypothetical protein JOZ69_24905 [Myxococcales bacterium]|nr:hypothetical protein [Myxococcales bacterium]